MEGSATTLSLLRNSGTLVLVNPKAGGGRAEAYLTQIEKLFRSLEVPAELITARSTEELQAAAHTAISGNRRMLFVMGGDGTFQAVANVAHRTEGILGLLPAGGGNDFAKAIGIPNHPVRAAEALVHGNVRPIDLVRACTGDGRTRLYVGGGGVGLDAEAARHANGVYRNLPGRLRYIASALRALVGYTPLEIRLEFPGKEADAYSGQVLLACVLNTPTYGGGLRLAPGATPEDGLLHVVAIADLTTFEILKLLPRLAASGELRTDRVRRWQVRCVRLSTGRPCLFHGDGELLGPTPVEIDVLPRAIQMLTP